MKQQYMQLSIAAYNLTTTLAEPQFVVWSITQQAEKNKEPIFGLLFDLVLVLCMFPAVGVWIPGSTVEQPRPCNAVLYFLAKRPPTTHLLCERSAEMRTLASS